MTYLEIIAAGTLIVLVIYTAAPIRSITASKRTYTFYTTVVQQSG